MRERIRFLLIYYAFWVVFFIFARILFLAYHIDDAKHLTLELVYGIFKSGIVMDLSMAAYYSIFPFLWVTFSNFIYKSVFQNTIFSYTFIVLAITNILLVTDLEVYNTWNFRLDETPLNFLTSPSVAFLSIKKAPLFKLFISGVLLFAVAGIILYRILANRIYDWKKIKKFSFIPYGLILTLLLIIPIRGGLFSKPLKQDTVFFSENNFANISALNAPWNFYYSLLKKVSPNVNSYTYLPKERLENVLEKLFLESGNTQKVGHFDAKTNVLLIIVENLSSKVIDFQVDSLMVTPSLNQLKRNSIYFDNMYASSDLTYKTLISILSGYPAQPKNSILEYPHKMNKLNFLSSTFSRNGYSSRFYFGGDANYMQFKKFLYEADYDKIVDYNDFNTDKSNFSVSDEIVFSKLLEDHSMVSSKPFFSTVLTVSGIENSSTSSNKKFGEEQTYYNSMSYTDSTINTFLLEAKKQPWWNNTLVVIVGSKGNKLPDTKDEIDNFKIPMFWTGGVIHSKLTIKNATDQTDIASTILNQLSISNTDYPWSKNIFDNKTKPWAFSVFNNGFIYVTNRKRIIFDNVGKRELQGSSDDAKLELEQGKALQQKTYQDFLDK